MELAIEVVRVIGQNFGWIFGLVVIAMLRKPFSGLLDRTKTLKGSMGETSLVFETEDVAAIPSAPTPASPPESDAPLALPELPESEPEGEDAAKLYGDMHRALGERDFTRAREKFEKLLAMEVDNGQDELDRRYFLEGYFRNEVYRLTGDRAEVERLELMGREAKTDDQRRSAYVWLHRMYVGTGDTRRAIELMKAALDLEWNEGQRTEWTINLAAALRQDGRPTEALVLLEERLSVVETDVEREGLFQALHKLEKERGNSLAAAVALEKALELNPAVHTSLFDAAYSESEAGLELLSLKNYSALISLDAKHPSALNNLGVTAGRLEVKGKQAAFFKRAADETTDSLAMANLARLFMDSGFFGSAKSLLDQARKLADPDPNVGKALASLERLAAADEKKWDELSKKADEFQRQFRIFGDAFFDVDRAELNLSGKWIMDGHEFLLEEEGSRISADWMVTKQRGGLASLMGGANTVSTHKISIKGLRRNGSASVSYHRRDAEASPSILSGTDENVECLSYLSSDGTEWHIFSTDPGKSLQLVARRAAG